MTRRRFRAVAFAIQVVALGLLIFTSANEAQSVAGTIAGTGSRWDDMALYEQGQKLFIDDLTGSRVLVYDARTLAYLTEISFSSVLAEVSDESGDAPGDGHALCRPGNRVRHQRHHHCPGQRQHVHHGNEPHEQRVGPVHARR